jgi:hypothetical protein
MFSATNYQSGKFNMAMKKAKGILRIEFLDNHPAQVILADYLRSTGDAKGHVLTATTAYFYAIALTKQADVSRQEKEMALAEAIRGLDTQKRHLIDYYRIFEKTDLSLESLPIVDLSSIQRFSPPPGLTVPVDSISSIPEVNKVEQEENDDDDDEYQCRVGDPNSPVTLNF